MSAPVGHPSTCWPIAVASEPTASDSAEANEPPAGGAGTVTTETFSPNCFASGSVTPWSTSAEPPWPPTA